MTMIQTVLKGKEEEEYSGTILLCILPLLIKLEKTNLVFLVSKKVEFRYHKKTCADTFLFLSFWVRFRNL